MALNFVTSASALAGNPLHVTVYDGNGGPVDTASVVWSGLPATCTVTADPAGFNFWSTVTGIVAAKASVGAASATIVLTFLGLKFTANP